MSRSVEIKVATGGALSASLSDENVGPENYVRKLNLRRENDQDLRREGWKLFKPDEAGSDSQSVYDGTEIVQRLAELLRPNGDRVLVGASRTLIKKFDSATGQWTIIGSGFSPNGKRWQTATLNGYLILNNTVDLFQSYRVEDATVTPVWEAREVGIARAGRICENNGFLLLADITEFQADQLDAWMRGYQNYPVSTTLLIGGSTPAANVDSGKQFDVSATATISLPNPPSSQNFYLWVRKVGSGGPVDVLPTVLNQNVSLTGDNDLALIWWDPVKARYAAKIFINSIIPAFDPYGTPPDDILNHKPWKVFNGEFGQPTHWAPSFSVLMNGPSTTIQLPFASKAFIKGTTRVAVVNGGSNNGTLGGDIAHPDGMLITNIVDNTITIEVTTDTLITYPRIVTVMRWTDVSTLVAAYEIQGDGSQIVGMMTLQNLVILYRRTGIYVGRYTGLVFDAQGNQTGPYSFRERYKGYNVPRFGDCIVSVRDDYHVYPAQGNRFYQFDGSYQPELHKEIDLSRNVFFSSTLGDDEECWAIDNPVTREVWFIRPGVVTLAFAFESKTCSEIDVGFDAAAFVQRPGNWLDRWFVLGISRTVSVYGKVEGQDPFTTWLRNGVPTQFRWKTGLAAFNDQSDEKDLYSYTPLLSSQSPNYALQLQLYATWNPAEPGVALLNPVQNLPTPEGDNICYTFFRSVYFQAEIVGVDTRDIDFRLSAQLWEIDKISAGGVNRQSTG